MLAIKLKAMVLDVNAVNNVLADDVLPFALDLDLVARRNGQKVQDTGQYKGLGGN